MLIKASEFLLYCSDDESVRLNVLIKDENIWLTQKAMAELFDVNPPAINKHLSNIFAEGELEQESTISKMEIVQQEGHRHVKRSLDFYNLDVIISVGYRVNSAKATQFRIWATKTLKDYMLKGFVLDDERLKQFLAKIISVSFWTEFVPFERAKDGFGNKLPIFMRSVVMIMM